MGQDPVKINEMCQNSACGDDKISGAIPDGRQASSASGGHYWTSSVGEASQLWRALVMSTHTNKLSTFLNVSCDS